MPSLRSPCDATDSTQDPTTFIAHGANEHSLLVFAGSHNKLHPLSRPAQVHHTVKGRRISRIAIKAKVTRQRTLTTDAWESARVVQKGRARGRQRRIVPLSLPPAQATEGKPLREDRTVQRPEAALPPIVCASDSACERHVLDMAKRGDDASHAYAVAIGHAASACPPGTVQADATKDARLLCEPLPRNCCAAIPLGARHAERCVLDYSRIRQREARPCSGQPN